MAVVCTGSTTKNKSSRKDNGCSSQAIPRIMDVACQPKFMKNSCCNSIHGQSRTYFHYSSKRLILAVKQENSTSSPIVCALFTADGKTNSPITRRYVKRTCKSCSYISSGSGIK